MKPPQNEEPDGKRTKHAKIVSYILINSVGTTTKRRPINKFLQDLEKVVRIVGIRKRGRNETEKILAEAKVHKGL